MSMMIFEILFFLGIFSMFVFILVGQDKVIRHIGKELAEQRAQLARLEARLGGSLAPSDTAATQFLHEAPADSAIPNVSGAPSKKTERPKMAERIEHGAGDGQAKTRSHTAPSVPLSSRPPAASGASVTSAMSTPSMPAAAPVAASVAYEGRPVGYVEGVHGATVGDYASVPTQQTAPAQHAMPAQQTAPAQHAMPAQHVRPAQQTAPAQQQRSTLDTLSMAQPTSERPTTHSEGAGLDLFMPPPHRR